MSTLTLYDIGSKLFDGLFVFVYMSTCYGHAVNIITDGTFIHLLCVAG